MPLPLAGELVLVEDAADVDADAAVVADDEGEAVALSAS